MKYTKLLKLSDGCHMGQMVVENALEEIERIKNQNGTNVEMVLCKEAFVEGCSWLEGIQTRL